MITNGSLTSLEMTVGGDFSVGFLKVGVEHLEMDDVNGSFNMYGTAYVTVPVIGKLSFDFGTPSDALTITNGALGSMDITLGTSFSFGGLAVSGTLNADYIPAHMVTIPPPPGLAGLFPATTTTTPSELVITGNATITCGSFSVNADLGGPSPNGTLPASQGLIITNGSISNFDMTVTAFFSVLGFPINGACYATYNVSKSMFELYGSVSVDLPTFLPSWVGDFSGTHTLSSTDFYLQWISGDAPDSFIDVYGTGGSIAGIHIAAGLGYGFDQSVGLVIGDPVTGNYERVGFDASKAFFQTIGALIDAVGDAVKKGEQLADLTVSALGDAWSAAKNLADDAVNEGKSIYHDVFGGPLSGATVYYDPLGNFDFAATSA